MLGAEFLSPTTNWANQGLLKRLLSRRTENRAYAARHGGVFRFTTHSQLIATSGFCRSQAEQLLPVLSANEHLAALLARLPCYQHREVASLADVVERPRGAVGRSCD